MRALAPTFLLPLLAFAVAACGPKVVPDYFNLSTLDASWHFDVVQPETDEFWTLQTLDADDNDLGDGSHRGDIWFRLTRTIPDGLGPGQDQVIPQRQFNLSHEQDLSGSEPLSIGWEYKWLAGMEEGDQGEYFLLTPTVDEEWSEFWTYETGEEGASDFEHDVAASYCADPAVTSYGIIEDCIVYERTVTTTNYVGGDEQVLTTVHTETWAAGIGLVRYEILSSDGELTIAVLRTTNADQAEQE
jgi:hypothetical protein